MNKPHGSDIPDTKSQILGPLSRNLAHFLAVYFLLGAESLISQFNISLNLEDIVF